VLFQQVKAALQLLIDEGAVSENKHIQMVDCEGKHWAFEEEEDRTLKIVSTENGIDLIEVSGVTLHRWEEEMIIGVSNKNDKIILFFLERGDEYSKE
jgi:hypothetical protein